MSVPLAGVIGSPADQSRLPRVYAYWLREYDIAGYYLPMDVAQTDLEAAIRTLPKLGFAGVHVGAPHKDKAVALADTATDRAAVLGAANMLTFGKDGKIYADNTDGYGLVENLRNGAADWQPQAAPAVVFGAGTMARVAIAALLDLGVPELRLSNRTRTRAEALQAEFGTRIKVFEWVQAGNMLDGAGTVVNATVLGMTGRPEFRVPLDGLSPRAVVSDLVCSPLETGLLAEARANGCTVVDGLGVLLYSAVPGFERWFGVRPQVDAGLRQALLPA